VAWAALGAMCAEMGKGAQAARAMRGCVRALGRAAGEREGVGEREGKEADLLQALDTAGPYVAAEGLSLRQVRCRAVCCACVPADMCVGHAVALVPAPPTHTPAHPYPHQHIQARLLEACLSTHGRLRPLRPQQQALTHCLAALQLARLGMTSEAEAHVSAAQSLIGDCASVPKTVKGACVDVCVLVCVVVGLVLTAAAASARARISLLWPRPPLPSHTHSSDEGGQGQRGQGVCGEGGWSVAGDHRLVIRCGSRGGGRRLRRVRCAGGGVQGRRASFMCRHAYMHVVPCDHVRLLHLNKYRGPTTRTLNRLRHRVNFVGITAPTTSHCCTCTRT
jgi:hypothetical protein